MAYNAMATGRPLAIFRPADLADIVAAVRWAAEACLPVGVRGILSTRRRSADVAQWL